MMRLKLCDDAKLASTENYHSLQHDTRVLNGEKNPNLFPKPVYEAPPYAQRKAMYKARRHANHGRTAAVADPTNPKDQELYNALCRGDDLMVRSALFNMAGPVCFLMEK